MSETMEMPDKWSNGQRAIVREICFEAIRCDREAHAEERRLERQVLVGELRSEREAVVAELRTERAMMLADHGKNCPAMKQAGRLRTWIPVILGSLVGVLIGAGVLQVPALLGWLAKRI